MTAATAEQGHWLEPWHVMVIVSRRRRGKSTLATVIASYFTRATVIFVDVKKKYRVHDAVVVHGIGELTALKTLPARIQFVPVAVKTPDDDKAEIKEWDRFFAWCHAQHDICVLLDECVPWPAPASGFPGWLRKYVGQAGVNRGGIIACTGRYRGVFRDLFSHADAIVIFPDGLSIDELTDVAAEMQLGRFEEGGRKVKGVDILRGYLDQAKATGPYACVWWDRDSNTFRIFELPAELVDRAIATEIAP